ncbi:hypothetical protein C5167_033717 [Papaver somniferum]|uniref:Uncharacterized protein n=1 Tax=Papaver somniferum TaxID=3469 RepID=A0A4Y7KDX8_PAPSO|nr:hypothetical protein C5167_033717 [Papaver somniferum]
MVDFRLISQFGAVIRVHQAELFDKFLDVKILAIPLDLLFDEEEDEIVFKLLSSGCRVHLTGYHDGNGNGGDQASEANKESDDPKIGMRRKLRPRNTMTERGRYDDAALTGICLLMRNAGRNSLGKTDDLNFFWVLGLFHLSSLFSK